MSAAHDKSMQTRIGEIEALEVFIERKMVDAEDVTFVASLCKQYREKDMLSPKQWYWVHRMMDRIMGMEEKSNDDKTG
jgi:NADH:ubiquinone oxidoreductase subunit